MLFAANEDSDTVVPFDIDQSSGKLRRSGQLVSVGSPLCTVFKAAS